MRAPSRSLYRELIPGFDFPLLSGDVFRARMQCGVYVLARNALPRWFQFTLSYAVHYVSGHYRVEPSWFPDLEEVGSGRPRVAWEKLS